MDANYCGYKITADSGQYVRVRFERGGLSAVVLVTFRMNCGSLPVEYGCASFSQDRCICIVSESVIGLNVFYLLVTCKEII